MHDKEARESILELISQYCDGFYIDEGFKKELLDIILHFKGEERSIFELLFTQFRFLQTYGKGIIQFDGNEILSGLSKEKYKDDYYSLHIKRKSFNLRIIVVFTDSTPGLYAIYDEKSGKKITSYAPYVEKARIRLQNHRREIL